MTRPTTVAAFLEAHPLPWRAAEANSLTGPEWDVLDATGHPVPNHGGIHYVREWAEVFAAMGNEVGRLREALEEIAGRKAVTPTRDVRFMREVARRALADTAAPAAQTTEATDDGR